MTKSLLIFSHFYIFEHEYFANHVRCQNFVFENNKYGDSISKFWRQPLCAPLLQDKTVDPMWLTNEKMTFFQIFTTNCMKMVGDAKIEY